jgi:3-hydroxyacyl-[acyl-carrier-protein] dehydratase
MEIVEILELLPHRFPFVMVDRVELIKRHHLIRAWKQISANEPYMPGHFPKEKIMPGVMIGEALAQSSSLLIGMSALEDKKEGKEITPPNLIYLTRINMKFFGKVIPGDTLEMESRFAGLRGELYSFDVLAMVNHRNVAEGNLMLVVHT